MSVYIYIFEDGEICTSKEPPTELDRGCIRDGILQVLRADGAEQVVDLDGACESQLPDAVQDEDGYTVPS